MSLSPTNQIPVTPERVLGTGAEALRGHQGSPRVWLPFLSPCLCAQLAGCSASRCCFGTAKSKELQSDCSFLGAEMKILLSEVWLGEQGIQRIWVCGESPTVLTQKALEGEKAIDNKTHLNGPSQLLCSSDLHLTPLGSPASNTNGCCWRKTVWSRVSLCHNASIPRTLAGNKGGRLQGWILEEGTRILTHVVKLMQV